MGFPGSKRGLGFRAKRPGIFILGLGLRPGKRFLYQKRVEIWVGVGAECQQQKTPAPR